MASWDLFGLLVEEIFGSLMIAGIAVVLLITIIGALSRMSIILISALCIFYFLMFFTAAFGGVVAVMIFFGCSVYFVTAMIPWVVSMFNQ